MHEFKIFRIILFIPFFFHYPTSFQIFQCIKRKRQSIRFGLEIFNSKRYIIRFCCTWIHTYFLHNSARADIFGYITGIKRADADFIKQEITNCIRRLTLLCSKRDESIGLYPFCLLICVQQKIRICQRKFCFWAKSLRLQYKCRYIRTQAKPGF